MKYCPECGVKTSDEKQKYCAECGNAIATKTNAQQQTTALDKNKKTIALVIAVIVLSLIAWFYFLPKASNYVDKELMQGKRDCVNDLNCFAGLAKVCAPATVTTTQKIGGDNASIQVEIIGLNEESKCVLHAKIVSATGFYSLLEDKDVTCAVNALEASEFNNQNCVGPLMYAAELAQQQFPQLIEDAFLQYLPKEIQDAREQNELPQLPEE